MIQEAIDEPEELLDLVNDRDESIGTIKRNEVLKLLEDQRGYVRGVGVFLVNSKGELWIPRRTAHKKVAPNGLDFSAGEHVMPGESYQNAALRGLQEELHMTPDASKLTLIGRVPPYATLPYFHEIFYYSTDEVPDFNRDDFASYEWLDAETVLQKITSGEPAKDVVLPGIKLVLAYESEHHGGNQ